MRSPWVVPDVGIWSAPCVAAALAGVVHDRQRAAGSKQDYREDNQQGGFHYDLALLRVPRTCPVSSYLGSNEPAVNALRRQANNVWPMTCSTRESAPLKNRAEPCQIVDITQNRATWHDGTGGSNMEEKPTEEAGDRRVVAHRLIKALCALYPDRYLMLVVPREVVSDPAAALVALENPAAP
jgi:hypothetical protein